MEKSDVDLFVDRIHELLGEKLRVTGRTLEVRARRAGRALPRPVRHAAEDLVRANQMSQEPKMLIKIDPEQVSAAYATCVDHLEGIDEKAQRSQARFSLAATIIMQICFVSAVSLAILRWRGFV